MKTIKLFELQIYDGIITLDDAFEEQIKLKNEIDIFIDSIWPKNWKKKEKAMIYKNANKLKGRQKILNGFERKMFSLKH